MCTTSDLVKKFYGNDPIVGEDAANEILKNLKADAIEALLPVDSGYRHSLQIQIRLKHVASMLGGQIVPHLIRVISSAPWDSRIKAAVCFSGLKWSNETEDSLIEILKFGRDFDAERFAIESLGRLGAREWAFELERYARSGFWMSDTDRTGIWKDPFQKLSSYVLQAFTRFATVTDRAEADRMFRYLTNFIALRETHLPNTRPNSYMLVEPLKYEFTEWSVDPLIWRWSRSSDENLQILCMDILREIAPLRAAKFLLETAISPTNSTSVRQSASTALAELRVPQVAQRVSDTLKDPEVDRTFLEGAFSTLYALPADWSNLSEYVNEILSRDNEDTAQLHYSVALRGDNRYQKTLIERLDDSNPFHRWTSALALARLLGRKARAYLEHRAEDAGDVIERCGMYAAIIRAGDHEKAHALHDALTEATDLPWLPSIWKLEILDALRTVKIFDGRAFPLWRDANQVGKRQLQYFDALVPGTASSSVSSIVVPAMISAAKRTKIFISYSHKDVKWLNRLKVHLKPLERSNDITAWDDTLIKPGQNWQEAIKCGLEEAKVAVVLVSADFLASDFINANELPPLLSAAADGGVVILPIVLSPSRFVETKSLSRFQSVNPPSQPLITLKKAKQEAVFLRVSQIIEDAFRA